MLTEVILAILIGTTAGTITGLTPGIHINLISAIVIGSLSKLLLFTNGITLTVFIIAMSITHSFLDVIPSTFLGAPDPSKALMALPAHKMLLQGRAYEAIRLTVVGSFGGVIIAILISPLIYYVLSFAYETIANNIFWILMSTCLFMIFKDSKQWKNLAFFLASGILGFIGLNLPLIKEPLLPMLSGLFGISILINSLNDKIIIPKQTKDYEEISKPVQLKSMGGGVIAGAMTSFLPGLGASQGAAIASSIIKNISSKAFLILIGSINTVNFIISIIAYYTIQKARNGSIIAMTEIIPEFSFKLLIFFTIIVLITGSMAASLCLKISTKFSKVILKVNYSRLIVGIIVAVTIMILIRSNMFGLILGVASTALGIIAIKMNVAKNHLMGCLLVPVLIYFIPI